MDRIAGPSPRDAGLLAGAIAFALYVSSNHPQPLAHCLATARADLALCVWEGQAPTLAEALARVGEPPRTAALLVGPEGGLARSEVEAARENGWTIAHLGPRILRTETAGPAVIAILQAKYGDLGGMEVRSRRPFDGRGEPAIGVRSRRPAV
ncbi:MAG: RsmE family RNA methyltransferase [Candidatus Rokuibacteriota bacterium]